jgi:hypothetical protein
MPAFYFLYLKDYCIFEERLGLFALARLPANPM